LVANEVGHVCYARNDINGLTTCRVRPLKPVYEDIWNKTAYTDSKLFDFLLKHRYADSETQAHWEKSLRDLKRTPVTEGGALQRVEILADSVDNMNIDDTLWKANHGLCTNFALRVVFEARIIPYMKIGDNGHYRMAWTKESTMAEQ